jgi:dienelactone hydrolase
MDARSILSRRKVMKWGLAAASAPAFAGALARRASAEGLGPGDDQLVVGGRVEGDALFPSANLPGGGQTEIRLVQPVYTDDPDELEVAERLKPFNIQSWYQEWTRVAEKNERMADQYAADGLRVSASGYYLRASRFYRESNFYLPDTNPNQLDSYKRYRATFDRAWEMVPPPFERVTITIQGKALPAYFRKPRGAAGTRFATVIAFQGADSMAENTVMGGASGFVARGMAYLAMDLPGMGHAQRIENMALPPNTEAVVSPVIDYLETRPDVDPKRIAIEGISMGGYGAPRAAAGDKRIAAVMVASGSYDLTRDLFDYYPPIQDRVRWIIGAKDLADTRKKLVDYTMERAARNIECPILVGYCADDRIMDPAGAHRLYEACVNAKREMYNGGGHPHHAAKAGGPRIERLPTMQDWAMLTLKSMET